MKKISIGIIGGGAAGITAAISARRRGKTVVICEKMPRLGKKILISGNGRCNLLNDDLSAAYYNPAARNLVKSVLSRFGKNDIAAFFNGLGLELYSRDGRVFPITNQASSVLKVLEMELARSGAGINIDFEVADILSSTEGFSLKSKKGDTVVCEKIVIAAGGKAYPALGSDGNAYELAKRMGHSIINPVPSAVQLTAKDPLCHFLQGQKIFADVKSMIDGKTGLAASGELLFTRYGLSGTSILDISEEVSIAVHRQHSRDVVVSVDMAPFMTGAELKEELARRISMGLTGEDFLAGLLPNKVCTALKDLTEKPDASRIAGLLKDRRFKITGTRGWNEAEFTSGGVNCNEIKEGNLESKLNKGVYFAGEVLDVEGKRGGYNLAWAWASGFVAGLAGEN